MLSLLSLFILITASSKQVEGCIGTFPPINNSKTECSNMTNTCSVNCAEGFIFHDGNISKDFSCNHEMHWTPPVSGSGCVDRTISWYWIRMFVVYLSSIPAFYCQQAHYNAIVNKKATIIDKISEICNRYDSFAVGKVVFNKISTDTQSLDMQTLLELVLSNSSVSEAKAKKCAELLENSLANGSLVMHDSMVICSDIPQQQTITINMNKTIIDVKQCNESHIVINNYCVLDFPVVGGTQFVYSVDSSEKVTLNCEILFGTSILAVYWTHDNQNISISGDKYKGGTKEIPSLTINKLTIADNGEYVCHVENIQGKGAGPIIFIEVFSIYDDTTQKTNSEATIELQTTIKHIDSISTSSDTSEGTTNIVLSSTKHFYSTSPSTTIKSLTTAKNTNESEDSKNILYIAVGAGCGGFLIIMILLIVLIKSCRKGSHSKEHRADNRKSGSNDQDYDGLKDNILYVQSDDGLKDNILYVPSEEHDITDGNYSSVDLERSPLKTLDNTGNYSTVDLESPENNLASSVLNQNAKNNKYKTEFVNKAFETNGEDIKHIAAPDGSSNVYAVVDKKKNISGNTGDPEFHKPEITYAVVDKTRKK